MLKLKVTKIIKQPYKHIDNEFCCWEIEVEYIDLFDDTRDKIILRRMTKTEIFQIQIGYKFKV